MHCENDEVSEAEEEPFDQLEREGFELLFRLERQTNDWFNTYTSQHGGLIWEVVQPLAFALNPYAGSPPEFLQRCAYYIFFLGGLWDTHISSLGGMGTRVLFWVAVAVVYAVCSVLALSNSLTNITFANIIRTLVHGLATPLYLPILHMILARAVCTPEDVLWLSPDEDCGTPLHLVEVVVGGVAFALLACLSAVVNCMLFDIDCLSFHPQARATSQFDMLQWVYRTGLSIAFHLLLARRMSQEYCVLVALASAALATFNMIAMPYYSAKTHQSKVTAYSLVCFLAFVQIFCEDDAAGNPAESGAVTGIMIAGAVVLAPVAWHFLSWVRVNPVCAESVEFMKRGMPQRMDAAVFPRHLPDNDQMLSGYVDLESPFLAAADGIDLLHRTKDEEVLAPYVSAVYIPTDVELATRNLLVWQHLGASRPSERMLAMAARIYAKGILKYPESLYVKVHFTGFLCTFLENSRETISYISKLEMSQGSKTLHFCTQYSVFRMAARLRKHLGIRDRAHARALGEARSGHRDALELMQKFWLKVGNGKHQVLASLANKIAEKRERSTSIFRWMLQQHRSDTQVLLHYALFLKQVVLDEEAYERCMEEVERTKQKRANSSKNGSQVASSRAAGLIVQEHHTSLFDQPTVEGDTDSTAGIMRRSLRVAFIPLMLLLIVEFILAFVFIENHLSLLNQGYTCGQVRYLGQRGGVALQSYMAAVAGDEAEQLLDGRSSPKLQHLQNKLQAVTRALEAHHNDLTLTAGTTAASASDHISMMKTQNVMLRVTDAEAGLPRTDLVNPWQLGHLLVSAFTTLGHQDPRALKGHYFTSLVLDNLDGPVSSAFNKSTRYIQDASDSMQKTGMAVAVLFLLLGLLTLFAIFLMFVWNFNKTASSKATTLGLFTLIPPEKLKVTADEACKKLQWLEEEECTELDNISAREDDEDEGTHPQAGEAQDEPLEQSLPTCEGTGDVFSDEPSTLCDSGRRMSMSAREALKSLPSRRASVMATALKRGIADQNDLASMQASILGHSGMQEGTVRDQSWLDSEVQADAQAEVPLEVHEEPWRLPISVSFVVPAILFVLAAVACVEVFVADYDEWRTTMALNENTKAGVLAYSELMDVAIREGRRFAGEGDVRHYNNFWRMLNANPFDTVRRAMVDTDLTEREADLFAQASHDWDVLFKRLLISLTLTSQFFAPTMATTYPFTDVAHSSWKRDELSNEQLADIKHAGVPSAYHFGDYAEDTALPNANARDVGAQVSQHAVSTYAVLSHLCLTRITAASPAEAGHHQQRLVAEAARWLRDGDSLSTSTPFVARAQHVALRASVQGFLSPNGTQPYANSDSNLRVLVGNGETYARGAETSLSDTLFPVAHSGLSSENLARYRLERGRWAAVLQQAWHFNRVVMRTAVHAAIFDSSSAELLTAAVTGWEAALLLLDPAEVARATAATSLNATLSSVRAVAGAASAGEARALALDMFATQDTAGAAAYWEGIAGALLDEQLHPESQLVQIMSLKRNIGISVVFDDVFEHHATQLLRKLALFERTVDDRIHSQAQQMEDDLTAHVWLAVGFLLGFIVIAAGYLIAWGASMWCQRSFSRESLFLVVAVILCAVTVTLLVRAGDSIADCRKQTEAQHTLHTATSDAIAALQAEHAAVVRVGKFGDSHSLLRYVKTLKATFVHTNVQTLVSVTSDAVRDYPAEKKAAVMQRVDELNHLLRTEHNKARWLERIAIRMLLNDSDIGNATRALLSTVQHNATPFILDGDEVPLAVMTQRWNISAEADHDLLRVLYASDFARGATYNAFDTDTGGRARAALILGSRRYLDLFDGYIKLPKAIEEVGMRQWDEFVSYSEVDSQLVASRLLVCALAGLVVLTLLSTAKAYVGFLGRAKVQTDEANIGDHFAKCAKICKMSLLAVAVLLFVLFGVVFETAAASEHDTAAVDLITSAQWLVCRSALLANKISADFTRPVTALQAKMAENAKQMRELRKRMYFRDTPGSHNTKLLFETRYTPSGGVDTCRADSGVYAPAPLSADLRYVQFIVLSERLARGGSFGVNVGGGMSEVDASAVRVTAVQARSELLGEVALLNARVDPVLEALQETADDLMTKVEDRKRQRVVWLVLIVLATVLLVLVEYQFVFLPMLLQLVEEEEGTRLMLSMIPMEVRDSVPEIAQFFSTGRVDEDEKMKKLLQQSERLLQNILPPLISRRLKAGEKLIADDHAKVTAAFVALVGFDTYSKSMSAKEIVSFLNDLYTQFDCLTDKLDLEKIKTIGDVYFMCGGLTEATKPDHALRIVETVLQFFSCLQTHKSKHGMPDLFLKAGVNTGPAVTGVIGSKVAYDLWGDAVNVSSRLCGSCRPGSIALKGTTFEEVSEYYECSTRQVEAKGKGLITTYIVEKRLKKSPYAYVFEPADVTT